MVVVVLQKKMTKPNFRKVTMGIFILFIIIVVMYVLGYTHGFRECEYRLQNSLNCLIEDVKAMEDYKIERYEEKWEK